MPQHQPSTASQADLLARHRRVLPAWLSLYYDDPIELVHGQGRRVTDADGRTYLDFVSGLAANSLGYGVPETTAAIRERLETGIVHTSTVFLIRQQIELAERIADLSEIPDAKVFFCNSGSEANETALLLATVYRGSNQVLALRHGYHGRSFAAMSVSGDRTWAPSSLSPLHVSHVHGGYTYRGPLRDLTGQNLIDACVDDLRECIETTTSGDIACLIAEPVQGHAGCAVPVPGLFAAYKKVLDEYGILLIADEVLTGWGRTGQAFWGMASHHVTPDALTFAKAIGNGLAIGGVVARAELMDSLPAKSISTFGGNPLSMAAANSTLDYLLDHDLQANAATVGNHLLTGLRRVQRQVPAIGDVRGTGLLIGVELIEPATQAPALQTTALVMEAAKARGLLLGRSGMHSNVLRMIPPMTLTIEEANEALAILTDAIAETFPRLPRAGATASNARTGSSAAGAPIGQSAR